MNRQSAARTLSRAFIELYHFAPVRLCLLFVLMLLQGMTAGIGLLLLLPLLQLVGLNVGNDAATGIASSIARLLSVTGPTLSLSSVLVCYVLVVASIASLRFALSLMTAQLQQGYICCLRNSLYRHLLESDWQFIIQHKMSDFTHSLTTQVQALGMATQLTLNLLSQLVLTLVMVFLALLLSWQMSLLAIAFAAGLLALLLPLNRIIYGSGQAQLINFKAIFQLLTEQLGSLKMLKSYGSEARHAQQLQSVGEALEIQTLRFTRINAINQWVFMVGGVLAFSLFFYISQTQFQIALPTTLLLLVIFSRLLPQVSGMQKTYQQLLHKLPAFADVSHMFSACAEARECNLDQQYVAPILQRQIQVNHVTYCYPGQRRNVLNDFSVSLAFNQTTALIGPSGAGKSTLADLIAGLLSPTEGQILCDDLPLEGPRRIGWRQSLAYVTQEVFLFHDTVRANLGWVAPVASEAELWESLRLAAADEFVTNLPLGLDTVIGDRGVRLSGGERQRLALARALLSKPQLLILDEATSALDHANEQKIQQALQQLQGKLTILIIAHRETTIAHVDKTIELKRPYANEISPDGLNTSAEQTVAAV